MVLSLAVTYSTGDMEPEEAISTGQKAQWSDRNTNPPTKLLTQSLSCLQEMQGQGME